MKTKLKKIGKLIAVTVAILFFLSLLSPYNLLHKLTEENIVHDQGIAALLNIEEIVNVNYAGSQTYIITTFDRQFVAVKKYYSLMNYKWYLYEKTREWG
ncbi:hypothetical protein [Bacillus sp. FJAT-27245]|uniref:hypothetical protein n=1 Tax=Bacillus sp. FJAT-27245 TaxID=1684144 RepID=UPI0006A7C12F|nr:hypothetical protein [Bacillus sp. FJAT-27245]